MSDVVLFQSSGPHRPVWIDACMETVQYWASKQGWHYRFVGDELFDTLEPTTRQKLQGRNPIQADIGRLDLMHNCLTANNTPHCVIWVDADTLCLDPTWIPNLSADACFGEECWVQQRPDGTWRRYLSPHNAFMCFDRASPVLPFLRYAARSIINRIDGAHIAPQVVGPKLLKTLNNVVGFTLLPEAGALSPALRNELLNAPGAATHCYQGGQRPPLALVNLCHSLVGADDASEADMLRLIAEPHRFEMLSRS